MVKIDFPHLTQTPGTNSGYWWLCSLKCELENQSDVFQGQSTETAVWGKHRLGSIHISNNVSIGGQQSDFNHCVTLLKCSFLWASLHSCWLNAENSVCARLCVHEIFVCVSAWLKGLKRCATWHLEGSASDKDSVGCLSYGTLYRQTIKL